MDIPFLQAKYYTDIPPATPRHVDLPVIHCAGVIPKPGMAEWLMKYCAANDRRASWHYAVDSGVVTQSVHEDDVAWHSPGANAKGIGIELATVQQPTPDQWADPYHQKMLTLAAWLTAGICARWKIDPFVVDAKGLLEGRRGITTHAFVSTACKTAQEGGMKWSPFYNLKENKPKSDHQDPGSFFPMDAFVADIASRLTSGNYQA